MKTITATEFKKNLGSYLDAVKERDEIYITKNNHKIARLAPIYTELDTYFMMKEEALHYGNLRVGIEEFKEIAKKSDKRLEYLDGEILQMASPSMKHQEIVGNIYYAFTSRLQKHTCKAFLSPFDLYFYKQNTSLPDVLQPDVFVACDLEKQTGDDDYTGVPTIVVEVLSASTRNRDTVYKLNTYMSSGVKEYWIVDPVDQQIMIYTFEDYTMQHVRIYDKGAIKSILDFEVSYDEIL